MSRPWITTKAKDVWELYGPVGEHREKHARNFKYLSEMTYQEFHAAREKSEAQARAGLILSGPDLRLRKALQLARINSQLHTNYVSLSKAEQAYTDHFGTYYYLLATGEGRHCGRVVVFFGARNTKALLACLEDWAPRSYEIECQVLAEWAYAEFHKCDQQRDKENAAAIGEPQEPP